jgi:hypothetical protein
MVSTYQQPQEKPQVFRTKDGAVLIDSNAARSMLSSSNSENTINRLGNSNTDKAVQLSVGKEDSREKDEEVEEQEEQNDQTDASNAEKGDIATAADDEVTDIVNAVVKCRTTMGDLVIDVRAAWAPLGAARFLDLVELGLFTNLPFFRVCPKYMTQFGLKYFEGKDPTSHLEEIKDDPSLMGIRDMDFGYLFFAVSSECISYRLSYIM